MTISNTFSISDSDAQQHSDRLLAVIQQQIAQAGGKISFADYMQLCLYYPGLGYYSAGSDKFGPQGDFTTAPELSPLFSRTLAHHLLDVMHQLPEARILEFGAGTGKMACDILLELEDKQMLPEAYYILEASANLRHRQRATIEKNAPQLISKVIWLDTLPENFIGIIVANEVCDAMPVHRLYFNDQNVTEYCIKNDNDTIQFCQSELTDPALIERSQLIQNLIGQGEYSTEINLAAEAWLASLADVLQQGAIFIIDYGYPRASYYHPQRNHGTLMCYHQHQGHDDPLILQGLQDITSHVDFTGLAETALDNGLTVAGFQSQADFLLAGGITNLIETTDDTVSLAQIQQKTQLKRLTLPSEMGEDFKALTLTKNLAELLPRIQLADRRYNL